jgi:hypothetical protein
MQSAGPNPAAGRKKHPLEKARRCARVNGSTGAHFIRTDLDCRKSGKSLTKFSGRLNGAATGRFTNPETRGNAGRPGEKLPGRPVD